MSTESQIVANQLNAQKSTGPRTPEGKAKSALNAIRHGLCAQTLIIPTEKSEDFYRFSKNLTNDFAPANQVERCMVRRIVSLSWRLERAARFESLVLDKILKAQFEADTRINETNPNVSPDSGLSSSDPKNETNPNPQLTSEEIAFLQDDLMATAVYNDFRDERLLERIRRYENQMSYELNRAMDCFYKAQTIRIQRRLDDEAAQRNVSETLNQQLEIEQRRQELQQHQERFKKMSRRKILNYPGLENFDEVKLLSVIDYETFKRKVEIGVRPVDIAHELMKKYNSDPKFYTPERYLMTEARLYNQYHNTTIRRS